MNQPTLPVLPRVLIGVAVCVGIILTTAPAAVAAGSPPTCVATLNDAAPQAGVYEVDAGEMTDVRASCTDDELDDVSFTVVDSPEHGTLGAPMEFGNDVTFTLTSDAAYRGPDGFTLRASDGTLTTLIEYTIDVVDPQNDPPQCSVFLLSATGIDNRIEGDETALGSVSCADDENQDITFSVADAPEHGTLSALTEESGIGSRSQPASFTYTPHSGYRGPDRFTLMGSDGTLETEVELRLNVVEPVDDAPTCSGFIGGGAGPTPPGGGTPVAAGEPAAGGVLCDDDENQDITFSVADAPDHGTLTALTKASDPMLGSQYASFQYTPDAAYRGADRFTLEGGDGTNVTPVVFAVDVVAPVNDAPDCQDQSSSVRQSQPVDIFLSCLDDSEETTLTFEVTDAPDHGAITPLAAGGFTYTPTGDYVGSDGFSYRADDGSSSSPIRTVTIDVLRAQSQVLTPRAPDPTPQPTPPADPRATLDRTPNPAPPPPPTPPVAASFASSPKVLRVSASRRVTLSFVATPRAAGQLTMTSQAKLRFGATSRGMRLGPKRFTAPVSGRTKVTLTLSSANLRVLRREGSVSFAISVRIGARTFASTVRLRAPADRRAGRSAG